MSLQNTKGNKVVMMRTKQTRLKQNTRRPYSLTLIANDEGEYTTLCWLTPDEYKAIEDELFAAGYQDILKGFCFQPIPDFQQLLHWMASGQLPDVPIEREIFVEYKLSEDQVWPFNFPVKHPVN
jgi:hypothetical protein